jgi:tetratricopeptide (TPR) repeat protein
MLKSDMPSSRKAYEYFLRGNQLSLDTKQWNTARELYERCVEEDPRYAPAWARLGRIRHVMAKYLDAGRQEELDRAEQAFRRALDLNPDLPIAHKLYAQFEVDLGRARDAMLRLAGRAHCADPEIFAGLVSTCRYCGLLTASVAAHQRAIALDPRIRTSVPHTWFLQADHARVATIKIDEFPYIVPVSLAQIGRGAEALPALRKLEETMKTRVPGFVIAARTLLEGNTADSIAAVNKIVASGFRDPEGLFYLSRHLAYLHETGPAIDLLERVVAGGFFCYPAMASDPWLEPVRATPKFVAILRDAETLHREAATTFAQLGGDTLLG